MDGAGVHREPERSEEEEDWEGGEASELSAGLFSKHTAESLQLIHSLLFLELLCLPV